MGDIKGKDGSISHTLGKGRATRTSCKAKVLDSHVSVVYEVMYVVRDTSASTGEDMFVVEESVHTA